MFIVVFTFEHIPLLNNTVKLGLKLANICFDSRFKNQMNLGTNHMGYNGASLFTEKLWNTIGSRISSQYV